MRAPRMTVSWWQSPLSPNLQGYCIHASWSYSYVKNTIQCIWNVLFILQYTAV